MEELIKSFKPKHFVSKDGKQEFTLVKVTPDTLHREISQANKYSDHLTHLINEQKGDIHELTGGRQDAPI